jgi:hypothetical protein
MRWSRQTPDMGKEDRSHSNLTHSKDNKHPGLRIIPYRGTTSFQSAHTHTHTLSVKVTGDRRRTLHGWHQAIKGKKAPVRML